MEIINLRQSRTTQRLLRHSTLILIFSLLILSTPLINATGGFRLCGLKLTMTLNAICKNQLCGGYIMTKRADNKKQSEFNQFDQKNSESEETNERRKKRFYPYGAFGPVKKSGIATECCSKRCTLGYMKTYCCSNPIRFGE
ncbi:hypothetical protein ACQ4LE_003271 [Meloidogyne hapla]